MASFLSRNNLQAWLASLVAGRRVVAPVRDSGLLLFRPLSKAEDAVLEFQNTDMSPKEWLFPQSEVLFSMERKDSTVEITPPPQPEPFVIFGLRPCDAHGLAILDKPFLNPPVDTHWAQRRQAATLVGLACREAGRGCFCTSVGGGPDDSSHLDVMLKEVEGGYLVEAVTEKGKALLSGATLEEKNVPAPQIASLPAVPAPGVTEAMRRAFSDDYWDKLADRCIHCNVCAFVCPTCYCFDVRDAYRGGRIERLRAWDSCQSSSFVRIAGGYDRRAAKGERMRQRFGHKLLYFPEQFGPLLCTGCGRCVVSCPVNIDIREVIRDVQRIGGKVAAAG